jgi:putative tryptophan/tyrosine transport system substrate-binding protein
MNQRRKIVVAIGAGAVVGWSGSLAQQQPRVWRVGFLTLRSRPDSFDAGVFGAFRAGLRELGYVEGNNLIIEWRFADGKPERLAGLAAELVQLNVDVILTAASQPTAAAQKATKTLPIVIGSAGDPVASGFVQSLARPGGNITGVSENAVDIVTKLLEMLVRIRPRLALVAVLTNPDNPALAARLKVIQDAAQSIGVATLSVEARNAKEIGDAFALMALKKAEAVIVPTDPVFIQQWRLIADLAAKHRLPSTGGSGEYPQAGGLLSYGPNLSDNVRRSATYVDKILKGAKPADLPVEQPTRFELIINRKTASALGLTIPQSILISADKIIE